MPSDAWTEQETQLLKRAVRAVPSDLEKNDRWRQVAVLVGGGRGKKEDMVPWSHDKFKELMEQEARDDERRREARGGKGAKGGA